MSDAAAQHNQPSWLSLRARWCAMDHIQRWFLALMFIRWALDLLFMLNILPLDLRDGWYLHHGGDQDLMFALARSILKGVPQESVVGIGQALVMLPWIALLKPGSYVDIVVPMVLINGFLMGGLSVLLTGGIARKLTGSDLVAVLSAAVWACLPLAAYYGFFWHSEPVLLRSTTVPKLAWLNGLSDGPATFFVMVTVFLLAWSLGEGSEVRFWRMAGVGAVMGVAVMFRVHTLPALGCLALYVWIAHGWRALLTVVGAGLLTYLPQAWYNQAVFGIPVTIGYISYGAVNAWGGTFRRPLSDLLNSQVFSPANLIQTLSYFITARPWLIAPLVLGLALGIYMLMIMWRQRRWELAMLLLIVPLAYLAPLSIAYNFREDPIRFIMLMLPMLIIAAVYVGWWTWEYLRTRRTSSSHSAA